MLRREFLADQVTSITSFQNGSGYGANIRRHTVQLQIVPTETCTLFVNGALGRIGFMLFASVIEHRKSFDIKRYASTHLVPRIPFF